MRRLLLVTLALAGCFRWTPVALDDVRAGRADNPDFALTPN